MDFITSQDIKEPLTHVLHKEEHFEKIQKEGIRITQHEHPMLWKPMAFWISMDNDWERWCHWEDFCNIAESVICDVTLKKDLKLLKISSPSDAEELAKFLMPNYTPSRMFGGECKYSDMITFTMYLTDNLKEGKIIGSEMWDPLMKICDGIYFRNSGSMHFETFFNTWDAHSIALFNGKNCTLSKPRSGKEIMSKIQVD